MGEGKQEMEVETKEKGRKRKKRGNYMKETRKMSPLTKKRGKLFKSARGKQGGMSHGSWKVKSGFPKAQTGRFCGRLIAGASCSSSLHTNSMSFAL